MLAKQNRTPLAGNIIIVVVVSTKRLFLVKNTRESMEEREEGSDPCGTECLPCELWTHILTGSILEPMDMYSARQTCRMWHDIYDVTYPCPVSEQPDGPHSQKGNLVTPKRPLLSRIAVASQVALWMRHRPSYWTSDKVIEWLRQQNTALTQTCFAVIMTATGLEPLVDHAFDTMLSNLPAFDVDKLPKTLSETDLIRHESDWPNCPQVRMLAAALASRSIYALERVRAHVGRLVCCDGPLRIALRRDDTKLVTYLLDVADTYDGGCDSAKFDRLYGAAISSPRALHYLLHAATTAPVRFAHHRCNVGDEGDFDGDAHHNVKLETWRQAAGAWWSDPSVRVCVTSSVIRNGSLACMHIVQSFGGGDRAVKLCDLVSYVCYRGSIDVARWLLERAARHTGTGALAAAASAPPAYMSRDEGWDDVMGKLVVGIVTLDTGRCFGDCRALIDLLQWLHAHHAPSLFSNVTGRMASGTCPDVRYLLERATNRANGPVDYALWIADRWVHVLLAHSDSTGATVSQWSAWAGKILRVRFGWDGDAAHINSLAARFISIMERVRCALVRGGHPAAADRLVREVGLWDFLVCTNGSHVCQQMTLTRWHLITAFYARSLGRAIPVPRLSAYRCDDPRTRRTPRERDGVSDQTVHAPVLVPDEPIETLGNSNVPRAVWAAWFAIAPHALWRPRCV